MFYVNMHMYLMYLIVSNLDWLSTGDAHRNLSNCEFCKNNAVKAILRDVNELPSMISLFIIQFGVEFGVRELNMLLLSSCELCEICRGKAIHFLWVSVKLLLFMYIHSQCLSLTPAASYPFVTWLRCSEIL